MRRVTTLVERVRIVEWAEAGLTDKTIAQRLGWSQETVRKWRRRGQRQGRAGLVSAMGRPPRGALSTFPREVRETIRRWREGHPGWGPATLCAELKQQAAFRGQAIPSAAAIGRYLQEQGLTRPYERHSQLPQCQPQAVAEAHDIWEMDARGYDKVAGVGKVTLINLNDRYTHLRLLSYPCLLGHQRVERHADTEDYQIALRLAFTDWGLPRRLQVDHESVFYDNSSQSPFPSRLHLWLLALGVILTFSRANRPTDQGMTERSHQTWAAQALQGQSFSNWNALYLALSARRHFLNHHLPCKSLGSRPPLQVFPEAAHSGRPYRPEWEQDMLNLDNVYRYLAQGRWFRLTSKGGTFSLGGRVYYLGRAYAHQQLEITFDGHERALVCRMTKMNQTERVSIHGFSAADLMGEMAAYVNLPCFQLALPLEPTAVRAVRLFERMGA